MPNQDRTVSLNKEDADVFIPDDHDLAEALARTTHLAIGAHQDDIEIMAYHGIVTCYDHPDNWFSGIVMTNGSGSPRSGIYANHSDEEMKAVRHEEQRKAASIGKYSSCIQLMYFSSEVKDPEITAPISDLTSILNSTHPSVVYLHNPADKHDTHIASLLRSLTALRDMPAEQRPQKVYGCEVWRDLDWLDDDDKQALPVEENPRLAQSLLEVYDSQISGGKRYDLATLGRRRANATYYASHGVDTSKAITFAMDLTPLVSDTTLPLSQYTASLVDNFRDDVATRISKYQHNN